jgi:hypothetical protein
MIQPGSGGVGQVDQVELDDEEVIICSTHSAHKAVVHQPDTGFILPSYLMTCLALENALGNECSS